MSEELKAYLQSLETWQLLALFGEEVARRLQEVDYIPVEEDKLSLSDEAKLLFVNRALQY